MTGLADHRILTVPEGLAGERVDAAMARLFGLSRSRAADLIASGHVEPSTAQRSSRVTECCLGRCSTSASRSRSTRSR